MNTTRKQFEDAIAALVGIEGKAQALTPPVRLDEAGLHYGTTTVRPAEWTFTDGTAHALPADLKKAAKEAGKPGAAIGEIRAVADDSANKHARVKMCGVMLPEIGSTPGSDPEASPGYTQHPDQGRPDSFKVEDVAAVASCASRDDMRPVLKSVQFCPSAVVATDSYRLYVDTGQYTREADFNLPGQVIRAVAARKAERMDIATDGNGRTVTVEFTTAQGAQVRANVRTIDGQFPKYTQLFPDSWDLTAQLDEDGSPVAAAEKVARWSQGNRPGVLTMNSHTTFSTDPHNPGGTVEPVTISAPVEDNREPKKWTNPDGIEQTEEPGPLKIGINPEFFKEAAQYAEGGRLHAISPLRPVMIEQGTRRALVMPIRLND